MTHHRLTGVKINKQTNKQADKMKHDPQADWGEDKQTNKQADKMKHDPQADWGDGGGEQQAPASANPFHAPPESNPFRR